jgi:hypothetical protein
MSGIDLNDFEEFMVADYAPLNKPYTLTVSGASMAKSYDRKERKEIMVPALHFRETKKKMKLTSADNRHVIGRLYGSKSDGWIGKQIIVRVVEKEIFGERKRFFVIDPIVPQAKPTTEQNSDTSKELGQMLDLAAALGEPNPNAAVTDMLVQYGNDHAAALEVFRTRYAERGSEVGK